MHLRRCIILVFAFITISGCKFKKISTVADADSGVDTPVARVAGNTAQRVDPSKWPGVLLLKIQDATRLGSCSGIAISQRDIITAAHCLLNLVDGGITVSGKAPTRIITADSLQLERIKDVAMQSSDLAILEFDPGVELVPKQDVISVGARPTGGQLTIVGWGKFGANDARNCEDAGDAGIGLSEGSAYLSTRRLDGMLVTDGDSDCPGDSGGALLDSMGRLVGVVRGVASFADQPNHQYSLFVDLSAPTGAALLQKAGLGGAISPLSQSTAPAGLYRLGINFQTSRFNAAVVHSLSVPSIGDDLEVVGSTQHVKLTPGDAIFFAAYAGEGRVVRNASDFNAADRITRFDDFDRILSSIPGGLASPEIYLGVAGAGTFENNTDGNFAITTLKGVLLPPSP